MRAEGFRESERLKSALLDAVTHNLRTPLTSIKASATALLSDAGKSLDEDARRELLSVVGEEAERLNTFVGDLIGLAQIEAGDFRLTREWCSIEDVIIAASARLGQRAQRQRVRSEIPTDLPVVLADARALAESVYQLLENALKYSPARSGVRVSALAERGYVDIVIEDQGGGVPVEDRDRIFEKFHRGKDSGQSGLGMGLAIARGLARAHGGDVSVTSRAEDGAAGTGGSRFVVHVPIGDDDTTG